MRMIPRSTFRKAEAPQNFLARATFSEKATFSSKAAVSIVFKAKASVPPAKFFVVG
jgi:hypothetical protein